ncbi:MAG: glycosyltransferase [Bacteroidetes bacterium]|nr:glycosyltransferase [Bacteroidota bacterium]
MKLFVNTTNLKQGGSLQLSASVIGEFVNFTEHEYHIFLSPQLAAILDKTAFPANFYFYHFSFNPISSIGKLLSFRRTMNRYERQLKPDFVFTIFGPALWKPHAPHLLGFANGLYLYDKSRFIQEVWLNTPLKRLHFYIRRSILLKQLKKEATLLWTETGFAQGEISKAIGFPRENIAVISNTYGPAYESYPKKERLKGQPFTFLYLTADYPHKNLELFNSLVPLLRERGIKCRFRLTLPPEVFKTRFPNYLNDPLLENIGPIAPDNGPAIYDDADALFFPSLIETFSANYPEAMIMRRPIVTSDLPFARDICMDAALYFDPFDPVDAANAVEKLINNAGLREELVKKGLQRLAHFGTAKQRAENLLNMMKDYLLRHR